MKILQATASSKAARVAMALGVASAAMIGLASHSDAAAVKLTLTPATGPGVITNGQASASAGKVLTVVGSGFKSAAGANLVGTVQFGTATCAATPAQASATLVAVTTKSTVNATKLALTTPSGLNLTSNAASVWNLCVYTSANGNALIGNGTYTAYPPPTVTSVTPGSGPSGGGQTITVSGTTFSTKTTATLGGKALTGIKVATDGNSFTAVTPSGVGVDKSLVVTTEGGSKSLSSAYDYKTVIKVTPSTGPSDSAQTITVDGVGFADLTFGSNDTDAHVYLVQGTYDGTPDNNGDPTLGAAAECGNIMVIDDTELVCDVPLRDQNGGPADGSYTVTVVSSTVLPDDPDNQGQFLPMVYQSVVSSGATYTVADF